VRGLRGASLRCAGKKTSLKSRVRTFETRSRRKKCPDGIGVPLGTGWCNEDKGLFTSLSGEWETPQGLFDQLNKEFHFTLDACATAENAKVKLWNYEGEDSLLWRWGGVVWCNPPYGRQITRWIKKGWEECQDGATVVMLLPSRTDTHWWHDYCMKGEIRFIKGRQCIGIEREEVNCAMAVARMSQSVMALEI